MSDRWLLVDDGSHLVVSICVGQPTAPAGQTAYASPDGVGIGWTRQTDGSFLDPFAPKVPTKDDLKAYAAAARLRLEEGGITLPNGAKVKTDRESQGLIDRAVALAEQFPDDPIDFKASTGWVTVDAPTMLNIGRAVGLHVRGSFTLERKADAAIDAGTATATTDVDRILAGG